MLAEPAGERRALLGGAVITDPSSLMFHGEVVHRDGAPLGYVRAASYGHTLGGAVGLAMIAWPSTVSCVLCPSVRSSTVLAPTYAPRP